NAHISVESFRLALPIFSAIKFIVKGTVIIIKIITANHSIFFCHLPALKKVFRNVKTEVVRLYSSLGVFQYSSGMMVLNCATFSIIVLLFVNAVVTFCSI